MVQIVTKGEISLRESASYSTLSFEQSPPCVHVGGKNSSETNLGEESWAKRCNCSLWQQTINCSRQKIGEGQAIVIVSKYCFTIHLNNHK